MLHVYVKEANPYQGPFVCLSPEANLPAVLLLNYWMQLDNVLSTAQIRSASPGLLLEQLFAESVVECVQNT
jgi:hypothetical protein